jgi:hypothetical protein
MFGSVILEVGIGLILTFLLFSLILTSAQEGIESLMKGRAKDLEKTIKALLDDKDGKMMKKLYEHPLIFPLFPGEYDQAKTKLGITTKLPSYIPKGHFAAALADIVSGNLNGRSDVNPAPSAQVEQMFRLVNDATQGSAQTALAGIEAWYDGAMERLGGRYKRKTQMWLFVIAFAVAAIANVDAINVGNELATNQQLRDGMVAAVTVVQEHSKTAIEELSKITATSQEDKEAKADAQKAIESTKSLLVAKGLPIGRKGSPKGYDYFPTSWSQFFGWLITALAGMLGAPFWFDVLGKFMNVRAALKPEAASTKSDTVGTTSPAALATPFAGAMAGVVGGLGSTVDDDLEDCCHAQSRETLYDSEVTKDDELPPAIGGIEGWDKGN